MEALGCESGRHGRLCELTIVGVLKLRQRLHDDAHTQPLDAREGHIRTEDLSDYEKKIWALESQLAEIERVKAKRSTLRHDLLSRQRQRALSVNRVENEKVRSNRS